MDAPDPAEKYGGLFRQRVKDALDELGVSQDPIIERPRKGEADLCMVCFPLARELKMKPDAIALELKERIDDTDMFDVEVNGGYLNCIYRRPDYINDICNHLWAMRGELGKGMKRGKSIIIEHTSANPNGPFHVGRARNPIIGDTLVRIMKHAGFDVSSHYWVNDMGKQVMILVWGLANLEADDLPPSERDKEDHDLVRYYQKANSLMEEDATILEVVNSMLKRYENAVADGDLDRIISVDGSKPVRAFEVRDACNRVLEGMKGSLGRLNVLEQDMIYESKVVEDGTLFDVIEGLSRSPLCRKEEGARFIDLSDLIEGGDDDRFKRRFVFTKGDGSALYTTRDLAYHKWKMEKCDLAVNILGEDHRYQAQMLYHALGELGIESRPESVFYSFVSLPEGKMSTRRNRVVFLDDLLDDAVQRAREEVEKRRTGLSADELDRISTSVGIGALRFNIIKVQPEKKIVFRWEDALNFEGSAAPFVQYSHARACSILEKIGNSEAGEVDWSGLVEKAERDLALKLYEFAEVVDRSATGRKVHLIAVYLVDVASRFNDFYRDCPVMSEDNDRIRNARIALVDLAREVLDTGLSLLGVNAPSSM